MAALDMNLFQYTEQMISPLVLYKSQKIHLCVHGENFKKVVNTV